MYASLLIVLSSIEHFFFPICSSVDLVLERLCVEGTRKQAKYSVHAIAAITKDDGLKSLSVLYKVLEAFLFFLNQMFHEAFYYKGEILTDTVNVVCRGLLICWRRKHIFHPYYNLLGVQHKLQCQFLKLEKMKLQSSYPKKF